MKNIKWHLLFWVAYFLFAYFSDLIVDKGTTIPIEVIIFLTNNIYLFYSLHFLLNISSFKTIRKFIYSICSGVAIITLFFVARYVVRYLILAKYADPSFGAIPLDQWFVSGILWVINYFFYATAYFYFQSSIKKQKEINQINNEKIESDRKQLQLENALLRSQINPHFLYNTLGFLYSESLKCSPTLSDGIMKLSEIMHYSLRKQDSDGKAFISEEIEHIKNIVELFRLRFKKDFYFELNIEEFPEEFRIVPLVFLTLIENIFKHGEVRNFKFPVLVHIGLNKFDCIIFYSKNKKKAASIEKSSGLGLSNVRSRLDIAHEGDYKLDIINDDIFYEVTLIIPITTLK